MCVFRVGVKASAMALLEVEATDDSVEELDVSAVRKELENVHRKRDIFKMTYWENKMTVSSSFLSFTYLFRFSLETTLNAELF